MQSKKINDHFKNKVIWITGASSGIGRALTIALSAIDCQLYITSRSKDKLQQTVDQCMRKDITILAGDLTSQQANLDILNKINQDCGRLDIAILNAGTCEYVDIDKFDSDMFKRLINTNYMSTVYGIEAALPLLKQSPDAQLVGMSSTAAYLGLPRSEAYGASKAALRNLFAALRVSLKPYNICASVICPGFVKTELTDRNDFAMPALISTDQSSEYILQGIQAHRQEIHFPKRFSLTLKFIASLPNPIVSWLVGKVATRS